MIQKAAAFLAASSIYLALGAFSVAHGQSAAGTASGLGAGITSGSAGGTGLQNPLNSDFSTIPSFIAGALRVMVMVALPIISFFVVYSGFLFVSARGNTEKISTAKTNFFYVIIGAILILGAWIIATLIGGTVTQLTAGSSTGGQPSGFVSY